MDLSSWNISTKISNAISETVEFAQKGLDQAIGITNNETNTKKIKEEEIDDDKKNDDIKITNITKTTTITTTTTEPSIEEYSKEKQQEEIDNLKDKLKKDDYISKKYEKK